MERYKTVLTIAGSDSGGCAGIQADIKSISACGAFAASVITATTAQNTKGVLDIHSIPIIHLEKQLDAVLSDIEFDAIKIGMLHSADVIFCIQKKLSQYNINNNIVLDPVMVATSGDKLITDDAIEALKILFGKTTLITPNIPEAEVLIGNKIDVNNLEESAKSLANTFNISVLLKGGHLEDSIDIFDTLFDVKKQELSVFTYPKIKTKNTHGTGCSLSSSIAAFLAQGSCLKEAVHKGCKYIHQAIIDGQNKVLGSGHGPINHFGI